MLFSKFMNDSGMKNPNMPFGPKNYRIMLIGLAVLLIGFIVMASDTEEFGFGVLGLTVGPIIVLLGFCIQFGALLIKDQAQKESPKSER
jgi:hypothetical protein